MSNEKDSTNIPRYKSKVHLVELYTDSDSWNAAYDKLLLMDNVAYIHHNADNCKEHIHAVVFTDNQTYNTSLAKTLGIETKWIEQVKDRKKVLRYLIHLDNPDKHQYSEDEVMFTSEYAKQQFTIACDVGVKESEDSKVLRLIELIDSYDYLTYRQFVKLACENELYDVVRRSNYLMCRVLEEHNKECGGIKE